MSRARASLQRRLRAGRGFVFDMDGTLVLGNPKGSGHRALPGAIELLECLRARGLPWVAFTNGTAHPPVHCATLLRGAGFTLEDAQMLTPAVSAAEVFLRESIRRILVLGCEGVWRSLADAGLEVVLPAAGDIAVDAVYLGWHREFTMHDLEIACAAVWAGAQLFTASHVRFFATATGRGIGTSFAMAEMIRSLTGKRARVLGKPARAALQCAARHLGVRPGDLASLIVVGDDPLLEMRMARSAGALAVGVTTGLNDRASFRRQPAARRADLVVDGLSELVALLD